MRRLDNLLQHARTSVPPAPVDAGTTALAGPGMAAEPAIATSVPVARTPVPLRSLTRYQYDPAFAQFQQKLHRLPALPPSRPRLRPGATPPRQPKSPD